MQTQPGVFNCVTSSRVQNLDGFELFSNVRGLSERLDAIEAALAATKILPRAKPKHVPPPPPPVQENPFDRVAPFVSFSEERLPVEPPRVVEDDD